MVKGCKGDRTVEDFLSFAAGLPQGAHHEAEGMDAQVRLQGEGAAAGANDDDDDDDDDADSLDVVSLNSVWQCKMAYGAGAEFDGEMCDCRPGQMLAVLRLVV